MRFRHVIQVLAVLILTVAGPGQLVASSPTIPSSDATHGHFIVLGSNDGETVAQARILIDPGYACPEIQGGAEPVAMTSRQNPHGFPIIVCEAVVGFGAKLEIVLQDVALPLPEVRADASHIVVFGDTGCKPYSAASNTGCPVGSPAQPFGSLAAAAAEGPAPDVILHMGDYNYRGTGSRVLFTTQEGGKSSQVAQWTYDAGDGTSAAEDCVQGDETVFWSQSSPSSNLPDTWEAWRDDFFRPAGKLLPKAPWVFARGNHELCSRAGPGWFYFLDPHSNLTGQQLSCPTPDPTVGVLPNVVLSEPYAVDLGMLSLLVLDSANACDSFLNTTFTARYTEQMKALGKLAPEQGKAWVMTHRPIWGVTGYSSKESTGCSSAKKWGCINQTLQAALEEGLGGSFPPAVDLFLAGHMHRFQSVTFPGTDRPPVVVVGSGGVGLDPSPPIGMVSVKIDGDAAHSLSTGAFVMDSDKERPAFGYLDVTLADDGTWSGTIQSPPEGLTMATCGSKEQAAGSICQLASGVVAE